MNKKSNRISRVILQIGVTALLCIGAYHLGKRSNNTMQNTTSLSSSGTVDSTKLYYTIDYRPEDYKEITFADTARILDSIYTERKAISTYRAILANNFAEIYLRLKIYELEVKKTNSILPPNMKSSEGEEYLKQLDFFYDTTVKYYQTINGNKDGDEIEEAWNKVEAQEDVIARIKEWTERKRTDYRDAVEIYHPNITDKD